MIRHLLAEIPGQRSNAISDWGVEQQIKTVPSAGRSRGSGEYWTLPPIIPVSQVWHTPTRQDHLTGTSHASANSRRLANLESQGTVSPLRVKETCGPVPMDSLGA